MIKRIKKMIEAKRIKELKKQTLFDIVYSGNYAEYNRRIGRVV